jgi:large subunit ribosomal protein L23
MKEPSDIILEKQVTEKGTRLAEGQRKYIFRVARGANKIEIRRAVEKLFNVAVTGVNTMNYRGKPKRERSMRYGRRPDWKRAVVTLKEGQSIEAT